MEKQIHGGNIYDKEVSLDFSVNINPLGMPDGVQEAILNDINGYETYPDIRYTELREAVAGKERVQACLLYTSPSPRDVEESRMPSSA